MTTDHSKFLIALADQLDLEGRFDRADMIDENFQEFLKLLEEGKLSFDFTHSGGARDPRLPYGNAGRGPLPACCVPGPQ